MESGKRVDETHRIVSGGGIAPEINVYSVTIDDVHKPIDIQIPNYTEHSV